MLYNTKTVTMRVAKGHIYTCTMLRILILYLGEIRMYMQKVTNMFRIILEFKKRYVLTKNIHTLDTATW